jgi:ribonuclease E
MANKMLVDATHPEETRVVVLRGNRVQEFDFESANRKQLRGNIYLAKVTRVEPSLQAAFVDYGGNRHGFLAFSEIHPDYYQIPVADRQALIEAERRENDEAYSRGGESDSHGSDDAGDQDGGSGEAIAADATPAATVSEPAEADTWGAEAPRAFDEAEDGSVGSEPSGTAGANGDGFAAGASESEEDDSEDGGHRNDAVEVVSDDQVESVGAEDALEEVPERRRQRPRQYKIQEVIKRRQVLLVQVVKEERGNKGAALTTYLSLAGRYSVLMPNTARGGGISRKITSPADRKKMKEVVADLDVPEGMGIILRTAGASRTKAEVKRDFEYLLRLWEDVRELTLRSTAPTLVYEEGSLIKRSIRDLYNKDIDEIIVGGEDAYREAKDFMRMLMPSHAKNVKPYRETQPLFARAGIEAQLDAMFSPQVTLRSGGYLIINQTEALVSIDVNSGRSTREHNIEDTALQTNLEAAEEVARQLRLRDLAGLIVIDFIDMEEKRNNRAVERRMKDALKNDRARIQVGRISHFGLLEMSRQRIRTGVLESTTSICPHCQGTGHVRAPSSVALHVLRSLEEQLLKSATHNLSIRTRTEVTLYILNQKRANLSELEQRFGVTIEVLADEAVASGSHFTVERGDVADRREPVRVSVQPDSVQPFADDEDAEVVELIEADEEDEAEEISADGEEREEREERSDDGSRRRGRRRRRGRGRGRDQHADASETDAASDTAAASESTTDEDGETEAEEIAEAGAEANRSGEDGERDDGNGARRRRRGRRGGRRGRRGRDEGAQDDAPGEALAEGEAASENQAAARSENAETDALPAAAPTAVAEDATVAPAPGGANGVDHLEAGGAMGNGATAPQPSHPETVTADTSAIEASAPEAPAPVEPTPPAAADDEADEPAPAREAATERQPEERVTRAEDDEAPPPPAPAAPEPEVDDPDQPKKSGWWQRRSFF